MRQIDPFQSSLVPTGIETLLANLDTIWTADDTFDLLAAFATGAQVVHLAYTDGQIVDVRLSSECGHECRIFLRSRGTDRHLEFSPQESAFVGAAPSGSPRTTEACGSDGWPDPHRSSRLGSGATDPVVAPMAGASRRADRSSAS